MTRKEKKSFQQKSNIFEDKLEMFMVDVRQLNEAFFTELAINTILSKDERLLEKINHSALFWHTIRNSLHANVFIILGRIFDNDSKYNISELQSFILHNQYLFSKEALALRKDFSSEDQLKKYLENVYDPQLSDFEHIFHYIEKYKNNYHQLFRDTRRKVYAHSEYHYRRIPINTDATIIKLKKICIALNQLYEILLELYHNGRKPKIKRIRFSVSDMMNNPLPKMIIGDFPEYAVRDASQFFELLETATIPLHHFNEW